MLSPLTFSFSRVCGGIGRFFLFFVGQKESRSLAIDFRTNLLYLRYQKSTLQKDKTVRKRNLSSCNCSIIFISPKGQTSTKVEEIRELNKAYPIKLILEISMHMVAKMKIIKWNLRVLKESKRSKVCTNWNGHSLQG